MAVDAPPDEYVDRLVEHGVVTVDPATDTVTTTVEFEDARAVYHDTYGNAPEDQFRETVAEVFGLDPEEAEARIEAFGVTREQLVAYLALQGFLDETPPQDELAVLAQIVADVGPGSPVPEQVEEVDDERYEAAIEAHGDVALTVWKHHCDPCEELKEDLDDILAAAPEGVSFLGADGESVPELLGAFEVEAAPTVLLFRDGELRETVRGRRPVEAYEDAFEAVYG